MHKGMDLRIKQIPCEHFQDHWSCSFNFIKFGKIKKDNIHVLPSTASSP